jgi:hypothetical protein
MKKLFFAIVLVFIVVSSFSQSYRPMLGNSGDSVNIWGVYDALDMYDLKFVFIISNDTIISSKEYRVVETHVMNYMYIGLVDLHFMREDTIAKKVYVYDESTMTDVLLYDFSLQVGDSIFLSFGDTSVFVTPGSYQTNLKDSWYHIVHDFSIPSLTDTSSYRVLYLEADSMMEQYDSLPQNMYWVEGVGCQSTLDYRNSLYPVCNAFSSVEDEKGLIPRCYWSPLEHYPIMPTQYVYNKVVNGVCVYRSDSLISGYCSNLNCPCSMTITNIEKNNNKMVVFPNPTTTSLKVETNFSNAHYQVFDTYGRMVSIGEISGNQIDVSDLMPGLYFIQVDSRGKSYSARFVKE